VAGAGTGKTRVIVDRVRRLLETKGETAWLAAGQPIPAGPGRHDPPFGGPLVPEQILILTYNVKAAQELAARLERALGPATRARLHVSNFHAFCQRILIEHAADAGSTGEADVLDGVGQLLLLRDLWPELPLVYHASRRGDAGWWLGAFVAFINRAKDELVTPEQVAAFADGEAVVFEREHGPLEPALERLRASGNLTPARRVRGDYARWRTAVRAAEASDDPFVLEPSDEAVLKTAEREARRAVDGEGRARALRSFTPTEQAVIEELADTYVVDGAALEVLRLRELALVYASYQEELRRRGALDFGEQIAAVIHLFRERPNVLRRYQRQFRYILVDEFQDANVAQIELVELLGRTPDRPDNVMVVGDDDQSIYRFRGASYAAFAEFERRFAEPPVHDRGALPPGPPRRMRLEENHRSGGHVLAAANRLIERNQLRFEPDKRLRTMRAAGTPVELVVCANPQDEAVAIVDRIAAYVGLQPDPTPAALGEGPAMPARRASERPGPVRALSDVAVLYRKHRHRDAIVARLADEDIPYTVVGGLSLFDTPEIRDLEQTLRAIVDPLQDVALARMLSAGPWRLDALEILAVARMARYDRRHLIEAIRDVVDSGEVVVRAPGPGAGDPGAVEDEVPGGAPSQESGPALQPRTFDLLAGAGSRDERGGQPAGPPAGPTEGLGEGDPATPPTFEREEDGTRRRIAPSTRARLRRVLETLDPLGPLTWREGPYTILERLIERTDTVLDLIAADTRAAQRQATNIASLLRFAFDWQQVHPRGSLAAFVDYLDAYQAVGGELPTSVELSEDVDGVRLMTLYQAKGLEFPIVFVPYLLDTEWPVARDTTEVLPRELLREPVPVGDLLLEEERRLLYVAMTRAQERLVLSTQDGPGVEKAVSAFVLELRDGAGAELVEMRSGGLAELLAEGARSSDGPGPADDMADPGSVPADLAAATADPAPVGAGAARHAPAGDEDEEDEAWPFGPLGDPEAPSTATADRASAMPAATAAPRAGTAADLPAPVAASASAAIRQVMPLPTARERRLALRLRANELLGLIEGSDPDAPETPDARATFEVELRRVAEAAGLAADEARRRGLDPLTMRTVALDSGSGANLLQVAPLPHAFSYSQFDVYERCPLRYAFRHVYRFPEAEGRAPLSFGSTAHEAFERFTRERRERAARGEAPPTREDLARYFDAAWRPGSYGTQAAEDGYRSRIGPLLDAFWRGELATDRQDVIAEELPFELVLQPADGAPAVHVNGSIDRLDRLPSGRVEVIDYKTGRPSSQKGVDESLQLSIYALACRDALELGTPERVTLYFTEAQTRLSTTRTDEQLDAARDDILARAAHIRSGDFAATPSRKACDYCDFRAMCPARWAG
jgi:superfamily I DNA/RNA helicase/RecB family exonuclease